MDDADGVALNYLMGVPSIDGVTLPSWAPSVVALDLDGTCVTADLTLHPRVAAAVAAAAQTLPVVIATGRMYRSALPWATKLGVSAPLICYQGALLRELPDGATPGRILGDLPLAGAAAQQVIALARQRGWHRQAYIDDHLLCEQDRPESHLYGSIARVDVDYVDDLSAAVAGGSTKMVCVIEDEAAAQAAEAELAQLLGDSARVIRSLPQFVEVTNPRASKSEALRSLCDSWGLDIGCAIAVGDAPNDTDMLAAVGFGVAVVGARPRVLAVASATCDTPENAGVADVLRRFGLA